MLGLEYDQLVLDGLVPVFRRAEQEWLQNAPDTYGNDAGEVWAQDIFPRLIAGQLQAVDIEDLRQYGPQFLAEITNRADTEALTDFELREALRATLEA